MERERGASGGAGVGGAGGPRSGEAGSLTSALLSARGFRHAFFTRQGGVSRPPWDSLSFATSVGDDAAAVEENVARAAKVLGVEPARVYYLSQVHGVDARVLDGTEDRDAVVRERGDVTLSRAPGVACGVRSADCVPVLLGDARSGAVAAVHSGWRGTVANVVGAGLRALRDLSGGEVDVVAAIGPHIGPCCFEVGDDVAAELVACSPAGDRAIDRSADKPHVDLRRIVRAQLEAEGVASSAIDFVAGCTVCDHERFHSFRRDRDRSGRMLSAIVPR
jgi:YfiH family protein